MNYQSTYMWKEIAEAERVVSELLPVNAQVINEITSACEKRGVKTIALAGRGTSDHALMFFKYLTEINSGYICSLVAPSVVTMYGGKIDYCGTLVIGCSQSGYAADVIAVIEKANEQGAVTVAITNDENSPLAKTAKYHIYLNAGKEISVAATKTFTAQLYALTLLSGALTKRADLIEKYATLSKRIGFYAEQANLLTSVDASRLAQIQEGFTLARGITYSIAFESALKLQETSYVRMRGYATSDFYHGPMAMVGDGMQIIMYAPAYGGTDDEHAQMHLADRKKCIDKMLSLGASLTIVTDDEQLLCYEGKANVSAFKPIGDEVESMFAFALYAQMLACKISCGKGNDPDNPKALNKVTVTK